MKPLICAALLGGLVMTASCGSDTSASANVVARVNGKDITTAELDKQFQAHLTGNEQPPSPEEQQDLKLQILTQMINDRILLEQAAAANLSASDAEVLRLVSDNPKLEIQGTQADVQRPTPVGRLPSPRHFQGPS